MDNVFTVNTVIKKMNYDKYFMQEALREAKKAESKNEVPVGCVIVKDNKIIAKAHNQTIKKNDSTAHAEILAIRRANKKLKNYRLTGCQMYVTIEPCSMCAGALVWARIKKVVYAASDERTGACGSVINVVCNRKFNHRVEVKSGILKKECISLIQRFFKRKRNYDKNLKSQIPNSKLF
ncbi:MAG: tRNA adenosine(34) deaminase TadA [Elusimicrobia bacterium]|nr:tRNA adenosine(34) deaminase TadA [Elusimicrobiota bacterium]